VKSNVPYFHAYTSFEDFDCKTFLAANQLLSTTFTSF